MILTINQTILHGKYVIDRYVDKGGFSEIYQARDSRTGRIVAIKVIAQGPDLSPASFERCLYRFKTEYQIGAFVTHENVIKVYDLDQEGSVWFLISEFAVGGDLKEKLSRGPLPVADALAIGVQVCRGAAALHRSGCVHRDIKPSNILFDDAGRARLADLSLSQTGASIDREVGIAGHHPGTPMYMSPEQESDTSFLRPASDVYSLGCVLFEMLTGKVYKMLPRGASLRSLNPTVSPQLEAVIARALAEEIGRRYADGDAFAGALEEYGRTQPGTASIQAAGVEKEKNLPPAKPKPEAARPLEGGAAQAAPVKEQPGRRQASGTEAGTPGSPATVKPSGEAAAPVRRAAPLPKSPPAARQTRSALKIFLFVILGGLAVLIFGAYLASRLLLANPPQFTATPPAAALSPGSPTATLAPAKPFRVAVVMPNARNDLALSQSMYDSLVRIQNELGAANFEFNYSENMFVVDEAAAAMRDYASQGYDLVIAHGAQYSSSLVDIAPDFPGTSFAHGTAVDTFIDQGINNVFAYEARAEQGGYVNGVIAAQLSQSRVIGVVGPIETGDAKLYVDGFKAGVAANRPDAAVDVFWIGSFSDIALASNVAQEHVYAGADAMTGVGPMVVGAIDVCKENNIPWFGTQSNQASRAPTVVVASQVYKWDFALREIVRLIKSGTLGGKAFAATLENGGLAIEFNPEYPLSADVMSAAERTIQGIRDGSLIVLP